MDKGALIKTLSGCKVPVKLVTEDQQVQDIVDAIIDQHIQCTGHYDLIYKNFLGGDLYDVCERLWLFCKENFDYSIEGVDGQFVSSPLTQLKRGHNDCKGYALFIAGVLDAMKRNGMQIDWVYRFASYRLFNREPGHVFVVVNPKNENIWIDPVLDTFDLHYRYWWHRDYPVYTISNKAKAIAGIGRLSPLMSPVAIGNAENDLLAQIKQYSDGLNSAMQVTTANGVFNTISAGVLQTAGNDIPGVSQAIQIIKAGGGVINNTFGPGSLAAQLYNDLSQNIITMPIALVNTLFNGRTYNTDQYWMGQYHQYYVLGNAKATNINSVTDAMVIPAAKWFIDRLNVFVSGREHIIALTQSAQAYVNYHGVNSDTTTDMSRVVPAVRVAQTYFNFNAGPGSWKNTVGVFDPALIALANQLGESVEQVNNQVNQGTLPNPVSQTPGISPVLIIGALLIGGLIFLND